MISDTPRYNLFFSLCLSFSLWGNWERFLNSLLSPFFSLALCVYVCLYAFLHYSLFHRQQMLEGVRSSNTQTHFLTVLCADWFTSLYWYFIGHWPIYATWFSYACPRGTECCFCSFFTLTHTVFGWAVFQQKKKHHIDLYLQQCTASDLHCACGITIGSGLQGLI